MYSRATPYLAKIKTRFPLTKPGSTKRTYHVELDITGSNLSFRPGDSIGVIPTNPLAAVEEILHKLQATGSEEITDPRSNTIYFLRDYLLQKANISKVSFHKLFPTDKTPLPLLELLEQHTPAPHDLPKILLPMLPRFFSIASSPLTYPNEIHLTVAWTDFHYKGKSHPGIASHFLCEEAKLLSTPIPIYVQPALHFYLPDPAAPIILIGPGTGVAPFRAFLQERLASKATGLNWLFFGERNKAHDFYYSDYWLQLEQKGLLRLDTAFSRDQEEKLYVQHRLLANKKELWNWIENGAYIYVCGDAEHMAKDVEAALLKIISENKSEEEAKLYLKALRAQKRYLLDVY